MNEETTHSNTDMQTLNQQYADILKAAGEGKARPFKGVFDISDPKIGSYARDARGVRERFASLSFDILREISRKVAPIAAIQNLRCLQVRPFAQVALDEDELGFRVRLRDRAKSPTKKDKDVIKEIESYILHNGTHQETEEGMFEFLELVTRDLLSIDQIAVTLGKNRNGEVVDFALLDGATVKKTVTGIGFEGDPSIKYVQEVDGQIMDVFRAEDLIFFYSNRVLDIKRRGFGYSYVEMSIDVITSWLFAMNYNKEFFNSAAQPKGFISFDKDKLDRESLLELQREWLAMFRGVKGMWKTPFMQYGAKWNSLGPNNREMEYNQYTQMLASWIFAVHGVDAQEVGLRLNQAQNVLNENQETKILYSRDRGLRGLLSAINVLYNRIIHRVEGWQDYELVFSGLDSQTEVESLEADGKRIKTYQTVNELRAAKDLKPLLGGDVLLDQVFIQSKQIAEQAAEGEEGMDMGEEGFGDVSEWNLSPKKDISEEGFDEVSEWNLPSKKEAAEPVQKSATQSPDFVEVDL